VHYRKLHSVLPCSDFFSRNFRCIVPIFDDRTPTHWTIANKSRSSTHHITPGGGGRPRLSTPLHIPGQRRTTFLSAFLKTFVPYGKHATSFGRAKQIRPNASLRYGGRRFWGVHPHRSKLSARGYPLNRGKGSGTDTGTIYVAFAHLLTGTRFALHGERRPSRNRGRDD
jgi:hypothetical protein